MSPQTFIFIGRSGCGKGTQSELLQKKLKEKDISGEIFYLEAGAKFREFIQGEKYSNKLSAQIYKDGKRQPDFLAVHIWSHLLSENFKGTEHLFLDGICRSLPEAMTFTTALEFYNRQATVVYINVSREWSQERLLARGRSDDKSVEEIKKRLDWFDRDSAPAIGYFGVNERYSLLTINGEQTIEKVHQDVVEKLGW
jgi:adenylate kinase family enzyme